MYLAIGTMKSLICGSKPICSAPYFLLQVLDEIHRQPGSVSLSTVSLPAPESVVDSFPLKSHKKVDEADGGNGDEQ
jgi:hypothetical protein